MSRLFVLLTDGRDYTAIEPRAVWRAYSVYPTTGKMGRKRQRSTQAALTDDDGEQPVIDESVSTPDQDHGSKSQSDELPEERKKELDVWDAFKEEHHEGPFSNASSTRAHTDFLVWHSSRTVAVVVASPVQADARIGFSERGYASEWSLVSVFLTLWLRPVFHAALLTSVRRYVHLRESLAARNAQDNSAHVPGAQSNATDVNNLDVGQGGDAPDAMQVDSAESTHGKATVNDDGGNASPPAAYQPKPEETTRTILQHIAQTSEEALRTAEEKVNIAQTAYETVRESSALSRLPIAHPCI